MTFETAYRFLLLDDSATSRRVKRSLREGGLWRAVHEATTGAEAMDVLLNTAVDLLLADLSRPGPDLDRGRRDDRADPQRAGHPRSRC